MSLSLSKTDICNGALSLIGQEPITDLDTDISEEGDQCRIHYLRSRNRLLEDYPWRFAQKTTALTQDVTAQNPLFTYSYQLPSDFLSLTTSDADQEGWPYFLEGTRIITDMSGIIITYTAEIEDVGFYTGGFIRALETYLAERMSYALTKDKTLMQIMKEEAERVLMNEISREAQQDRNQTYVIDSLLSVRNEGN